MTSDDSLEPQIPYRVFFTHGSADNHFVKKYLEPDVAKSGANVFVDVIGVNYGDDFRDTIISELQSCHELIVLLTPTSIQRPWVFAEIGACVIRPEIRIIPINYGVDENDATKHGCAVTSGDDEAVTS